MPNPKITETDDTREPVQAKPSLTAEEFVDVVVGSSTVVEPIPPAIEWTDGYIKDPSQPMRLEPLPGPLGPEALIARAIDKGLDVGTMERLLAMRTQLKAEAAREAYFAALSAFQAECPAIPKGKIVLDKYGKERYRYAPLDIIVEAAKSKLREHGFSYTVTTSQADGIMTVTCSAHHAQGHTESTNFAVPIDPEAYMNDAQKVASAQTYAKRYAFCNAFGVLTGDEDDDGRGADKAPAHTDEKWKTPKAQNGEPPKAGPVVLPPQVGQDIIDGMRADWSAKFDGATTKAELAMAGAEFGKASQNPNHPLHKDKALTAKYSEKRAGLK